MRLHTVLLASLLLQSPTLALAQPVSALASPTDAAARLHALFEASDAAALDRSPQARLRRGDRTHAGEFGDLISDAWYASGKRSAQTDIASLAAIDRSSLNADDWVSYDVFKWQRTQDLRGFDPAILAATNVRPLDHLSSQQIGFAQLQSGEGAAPFKTVEDYEAGLSRMAGFVGYIDAAIVRFREGQKAGVVQPKLVVRNVIEQLDNLLAGAPKDAVMLKPVYAFPAGMAAAEQTRLRTAYSQALVVPSTLRLHACAAIWRTSTSHRPERAWACPRCRVAAIYIGIASLS